MQTNIVITGCSTGIGLETAKYLRERGVTVVPTARKEKDVERLKAMGFDHAMQLDVTDAAGIRRVIDRVLEQEGRIDVWFNNAGYGQPGAIEDITTEVLREQFETNLFGLHECTRQVIPIMRRQGRGKIIQHSSVLGLISLFGRGAYNASKYAIEGLTDTLRLELEGTDIHAILLNTGPIESDFRKNALKKLEEHIAIDRSIFKEQYKQSLHGTARKVPFSEGPESVARVVYRIVMSPKPKPRYSITWATILLSGLKRVLSTRMLDRILIRIG